MGRGSKYTNNTKETYADYVKNLKKSKRNGYFPDYYLKFVIIAVIVVISIIYFIRGKSSDQDTILNVVLSVAIEGDKIESENLNRFAEIIEDELNLDTENEKVDIFCVKDDGQLQKLLDEGKADIVISPEEKFQKWAEAGYFAEPGNKEELSFYSGLTEEQKYYRQYTKGQDSSTPYNYGIYLTGTDKYTEELGGCIKDPVAGISSLSENTAYAVSFLKYMASD